MLEAYRTINTVIEESPELSPETLSHISTDDPRRHRLVLEILSTTDQGLELEAETEPTSPQLDPELEPALSYSGSEKDYAKATYLSSLLWVIGFALSNHYYPTYSGRAGALRGLGLSTFFLGFLLFLSFLGRVSREPWSWSNVALTALPLATLIGGVLLFSQGTRNWHNMLNSNPWDTTSKLKTVPNNNDYL